MSVRFAGSSSAPEVVDSSAGLVGAHEEQQSGSSDAESEMAMSTVSTYSDVGLSGLSISGVNARNERRLTELSSYFGESMPQRDV